MNVGVLLHVRLLVEALAAVWTGVRSGVGVDQQVGGERGGALEALSALWAAEGLLLRVHGAVLRQADGMAERLAAHVAGEGSSSRVRPPHVHLQAVRGGEVLAARHALEGAPRLARPRQVQILPSSASAASWYYSAEDLGMLAEVVE